MKKSSDTLLAGLLISACVIWFVFWCVVLFMVLSKSNAQAAPTAEGHSQEVDEYVIAFGADWCAQCRADKPKLAAMAEKGVRVMYVDIDDHPDLARHYRVKNVPTYLVVRDGRVVERTGSITVLVRVIGLLFRIFI